MLLFLKGIIRLEDVIIYLISEPSRYSFISELRIFYSLWFMPLGLRTVQSKMLSLLAIKVYP